MKLTVVLLCLLGSGILGQSRASACLTKNPFISRLEKVTIFDKPQISSVSGCKSEWSTHGTCCDPRTLEEYAKKDEAKVLEVAKKFNTVFDVFTEYVDSLKS